MTNLARVFLGAGLLLLGPTLWACSPCDPECSPWPKSIWLELTRTSHEGCGALEETINRIESSGRRVVITVYDPRTDAVEAESQRLVTLVQTRVDEGVLSDDEALAILKSVITQIEVRKK